jgi:hypothetical protein
MENWKGILDMPCPKPTKQSSHKKQPLCWQIKEDSMLKRCLIVIFILIFGLSFFTSCSKEFQKKETKLDKNWGKSFESAKQNQILNPEAGKDSKPVVGMDGQAAEKSIEKQRQSFEREPSKEVYNIDLSVIGRE